MEMLWPLKNYATKKKNIIKIATKMHKLFVEDFKSEIRTLGKSN